MANLFKINQILCTSICCLTFLCGCESCQETTKIDLQTNNMVLTNNEKNEIEDTKSKDEDSLEEQLFHAIQYDDEETVKNLIATGVNINAVNSKNERAIDLAAEVAFRQGTLPDTPEIKKGDILWQLIESGASLDKSEWIVRSIVELGDLACILLLVKKGIDLKKYDGILLEAASSCDVDSFKFILTLCPNVNYEDKDGDTALIQAASGIESCRFPKPEIIIKTLLDHGANINHKNKNGETALTRAVSRARLNIVKLLLNNGADLKSEPKTLLHRAVKSNEIEMVSFIIEHGFGLEDKDESGYTPLHIASGASDTWWPGTVKEDIMKLLLEKGANPNSIDNKGNTPLLYCLNDLDYGICGMKILIKFGIDPQLENKDGKSFIYYLKKVINKTYSEYLNSGETVRGIERRDDYNIRCFLVDTSNETDFNKFKKFYESAYELVKSPKQAVQTTP